MIHKRFSLIELLVVVTIISILAGLLLPALQRAKASAHGALCMSNMKQIGFMYHLYVDDNDQYAPMGRRANSGHSNLLSRPFWESGPRIAFEVGGYVDTYDMVSKNTGKNKALYCPTSTTTFSYGWINTAWSMTLESTKWVPAFGASHAGDHFQAKVSRRRHNEAPIITERGSGDWQEHEDARTSNIYKQESDVPHLSRHRAGSNVVYFDGSVQRHIYQWWFGEMPTDNDCLDKFFFAKFARVAP